MTDDQKKRLERLRRSGKSYPEIADAMGMTRDAVRMYCTRNDIKVGKDIDVRCLYCGKTIELKDKGRKAKYCSEGCRIRHWRELKRMDSNSGMRKVCEGCGREFNAVPITRRYCSHKCYIDARFGRGGNGS